MLVENKSYNIITQTVCWVSLMTDFLVTLMFCTRCSYVCTQFFCAVLEHYNFVLLLYQCTYFDFTSKAKYGFFTTCLIKCFLPCPTLAMLMASQLLAITLGDIRHKPKCNCDNLWFYGGLCTGLSWLGPLT